MYKSIYVPVDNSDHSNRAITTSIRLGQAFGSQLVGSHVYSAKMHDYRFRQMEFTLPEEYLEEGEIARQRKIHDSLITMGLELISDCYLTEMDRQCKEAGLPFEKKMMDGKHTTELLKDIEASDYDLVVLGALGIGRTRDAQLGSVCERVTRQTDRDVWVVKHVPTNGAAERDTILVGVDGSPQSFGALLTAIELGQRFDKKIEAISVYDPYLHYSVFKGIVGVLTAEASKVFRFEEQNQLHEEIIDTGLAEIYQSHLNVSGQIAGERDVEMSKTLLDGKVFQKVLDHVRKTEPWLLILGRVGIHNEKTEPLGSNTDNLLRLCPCDILLTTREHTPELDVRAEASIHWTAEADAMLTRAPEMVRGIARTAILRLALEKGHSVVTTDLVSDAMDRYMPKRAQERTVKLAEALAYNKARTGTVSICKECGATAMISDPVTCTSCGATEFEQVTQEALAEIAEAEGGVEEETTYDGRKIRWTREARKALKVLTDAYQRRRAKARIEKAARRQRMETITLELTRRFIEEEAGVTYKAVDSSKMEDAEAAAAEAAAEQEADGMDEETKTSDPEETMQIVAHDKSGTAVLSRFAWTEKAAARILRVPKGFMRDRTQGRIEELAAERDVEEVDLKLVEEGIELGLRMMKEMMSSFGAGAKEAPQEEAAKGPEVCPVAHDERAGSPAAAGAPAGAPAKNAGPQPLNEVSVMSELDKERRELGSSR